jgi:mannobiose 2-epimerase
VKTYIIDSNNGDWFEGGMDKEPHFKTGPKSRIWKCTYHTSRALMNCIDLLSEKNTMNDVKKKEIVELAHAWKTISSSSVLNGEQRHEEINA